MADDDKKLPTEFEAEILRVGTWNSANKGPVKITKETLSQIVSNFEWFSKLRRVPIKLGHDSIINRRELKGGQPIFGEVSSLRLAGDRLVAKFKDVHKTVMESIKQRLFKDVSAEVHPNVLKNGEKAGSALTGVAILGIESPAVKGLKDLQSLLSDEGEFDGELLDISDGVVVFEEMTVTIEDDKGGEDNMDEIRKLEDEKRALEAKLSEKDAELKSKDEEKAKLSEDLEKVQTEKVEAEKAAGVEDIKEFCESMVKDMKMTPASRDAIVDSLGEAYFSEDNQPTISIAVFKDCMEKMHEKDTEEKGSGKGDKKPDDLNAAIDAAKAKFKEKNPDITDETVIFTEVMKADKELAARYMEETT
jgi:hypothetical protein